MPPSLRSTFLPILLTALFAAACGGSSTGANRATETPETAPALTGPSKDLVDLLDRGTQVQYKIGYRAHSLEGEEGDGYVVFNRPPLTRIDTVSPTLQAVTSLVIGGNEKTQTVSCSGGVNRWKCYKIEPLGASLLRSASPIIYVDPAEIDQFEVTEGPQREIAGEPARCFRLVPKDQEEEASAEYCLRADGVPLYTSSLTGIVEAWAVSADVSGEDFTPPAEPQSQ